MACHRLSLVRAKISFILLKLVQILKLFYFIESEESSAVRRIKLEYQELGICDAGVILMWDSLLSRNTSQPMAKVDRHMLTQAVMQG